MSVKPSVQFQQESSDQQTHQKEVRSMFDVVAPKYDLMNDVMSMGIHRLWKAKCVKLLDPCYGETIVDLAGGTGDLAAQFIKRGAKAIVCDPCLGMMNATSVKKSDQIDWVAAYGETLPFADNSLDGLSIAFGLRNMSNPEQGLREIYRTLKPGGRFLCLEFSHAAPWLKPIYDAYSIHIIPQLGALIAGEKQAYKYLIESIREFPDQITLAGMMHDCGFQKVQFQNLSFGIAAIHTGIK
ncbi:bifunctional demethylmenaquinone methyltransferase/2-methoxy-6-polyprenyl-1,4-benzoquinol methylase UbiE [Terasakiella sp. A23]|uniref:bifunctional demethylmenaquinone methyltransferase/2-methoxy-6-polyprenyl-1,4-benzoquinol methylase UbiE n=1 Tax=Terasakiella sp. FCG-A23 TaxID=3080561 RepID=UPI002952E6EC|nr:bifunctional demethylmenaquinone methyltransferase/2-methoxy-6-polyprenyl-1,4-benzoquinol methylase UbiE [Terasakiella sp. A23]MDV7341071.1 bifunctional demethylmenaquinone methyltransferase/2-methoxy-6-polyprenyl-1,4-benzoquinol methylase UbiE [Terasakiella sp. A23]